MPEGNEEVWANAPVVAAVGSRELSPEEADMLQKTARWIIRHGMRLRSGGARGSDSAWAEGAAALDPSKVTVCAPSKSRNRIPRGAHVETPPYPERYIEIAKAEWELGEKFPELGLPPYDDEMIQEKVQNSKGWKWLEESEQKKNDKKGWNKIVRPDEAYVQQLMIRNVAILHPAENRRADIVLGLLGEKKGGGGTGHTFRVAKAMGIPTFNLRDLKQAREAREFLNFLAGLSTDKPVQESSQERKKEKVRS